MPIAVRDETRPEEASTLCGRDILHTGNILNDRRGNSRSSSGAPPLGGSFTAAIPEALVVFKRYAKLAALSIPAATQAKTSINETAECSAKLIVDTRRPDLNAMAVSAAAYAMNALSIPQFTNLTVELCPADPALWRERGDMLQSVCSSLQPFASAGIHLAGLEEEQILKLEQDSMPVGITGLYLSPYDPPPSQALRSLCDQWGWQLFCGGSPTDLVSLDVFDQIGCSWILRYTGVDRCHSVLQQTGYFFGPRH